MEPDLDDTRRAAPKAPDAVRGIDHEDTVARGAVPASVQALAVPVEAPPALVEPPAPSALPRPLPRPEEAAAPAPAPVAAEPDPAPPVVAAFRAVLLDGTEFPIDGPVYVGRRPSAPRIHTGPPPRLVTFPSPARELSATHLELKLVGGSLVASDMRSTNGTVVHLPGSAPRTLIRGESAVLVPGTRIDLGEGAVLDILASAVAS